LSDKKCNDLSGKEWLQNSFSIWRGLVKNTEEKAYKHPASYPVSLCEKLIKTFAHSDCRVIDPFNGIGSTTTAADIMKCEAIGIDLSSEYCEIARKRLSDNTKVNIINGNSFDIIPTLQKEHFDLCITSPPYWDILNMKRSVDKKDNKSYSNSDNDLGNITEYNKFIAETAKLFEVLAQILKKGGYCIINVMDIRKKSEFYPLHSDLATAIQDVGYIYDDLIIWDRQADYNNMRPLGYPYRFRINKVHEYLLIFIKK
jgi:DNA modification methylase